MVNVEDSLIGRVDKMWKKLLMALGWFACIVIMLMVIVICADVLSRAFQLGNLPWASEVAEYALYLATFFAAPLLLREGRHVRMDMLLRSVPAVLAWGIELLADGLAAATCFVMAVASLNAAIASSTQGSLIMKIFVFPEWWLIFPAAVIFLFLGIEFLFRMRRQWQGPKTVREEATSAA